MRHTYDIPAMIETAETRRRVHGQPQAKLGHRESSATTPPNTRISRRSRTSPPTKGCLRFLIVYVASHPDTSAQAERLANVLREAKVPVRLYAGKDTNHSKINDDLGIPDDPGTGRAVRFRVEYDKE